MQLNIQINLDNSAYENVGWELGENLDQVINRIGQGVTEGKVRDSNGNVTGQWSIEDQETQKFIKDHFQFIRVGD